MGEIKRLDIFMSAANVDEAVRKILANVRPEWDPTCVQYQRQSKGLLNMTLVCRYPDTLNGAVVIKTAHPIYSGSIEVVHQLCQFLHDESLGPPMLALFNNGLCMEFIEGESLDWGSERVYDDDAWRKIAAEAARWHAKAVLENARKRGIRKTPNLYVEFGQYWSTVMESPHNLQYANDYPTAEELQREERALFEDLLSTDDLEPAFCHLDLTPANTIITENGAKLVDFDFSGLSFAQLDIAWFFSSFSEHSQPGSHQIPGKAYETKFLHHYLTVRKSLDTKRDDAQVTDTETEKLYHQVQLMKLAIYLRTVMICPLFTHTHGPRPEHHRQTNAIALWRNYQNIKATIYAEHRTPLTQD